MWVLQSSLAWGQPDNDSFQRRSLLQGTDATLPWFSYRATAEPGERSPLGASPGEVSLWWTWRAPESGWTVVTADFAPYTDITNRLVVAQGDSVQTLSGVAEPAPERVEFHAIEGQTYQIGLILHGASTFGSLSLHLPARPANDRFEERIRLPGKPDDVAEARFFGATPEAGGVDPFLKKKTIRSGGPGRLPNPDGCGSNRKANPATS